MRRIVLPLFSLSTLAIAGCGDSKTMATTDAAPCGGHGQPACPTDAQDAEYLKHEGGEVRLQFFETNTGTQVVVLYAWFLGAQTPEKLPNPMDGCSNVKSYPNITNPGMDVNNSRTWLDVGDTVTLTGAGQQVVLSRYQNIPDLRGLNMGIEYAKDGAVRGTVPPTMMLRGALYDINLSGMGEFPGKLKIPTQWEVTGGNLVFGLNAVNNLKAGQDMSWQYSYIPGEEFVDTSLLIFTGNNTAGMPEQWFCVFPITGRIDLPASTIAQLPPSGLLQAALVSHQQINFNGRAVDVFGVTCRQTPYTIQ